MGMCSRVSEKNCRVHALTKNRELSVTRVYSSETDSSGHSSILV